MESGSCSKRGRMSVDFPATLCCEQTSQNEEPVAGAMKDVSIMYRTKESCKHAADAEALREQVKQLSSALGAETGCTEEAKAAAEKSESESRALAAQLAALREELSRLRVSSLEKQLEAQKELFAAKEQAKAREISALEETVQSFKTISAQSEDEPRSDRFHYVLASNGQEGSISRSVLMSDPASALSKMYSGEWDYAKDARGRAVVTCHPKRWAAVLEHLATGGVPAERDPLLLAQARFWGLQRLVEGLEALTPGVMIKNDSDQKGFKVRCTFASVMEKMSGDGEMSLVFATCGKHWWSMRVTQSGTFLYSKKVPSYTSLPVELEAIEVSFIWHLLLREERVGRKPGTYSYPSTKETGCGYSWGAWGYGIHELISEPLARAPDSLVIEIEVRYVED